MKYGVSSSTSFPRDKPTASFSNTEIRYPVGYSGWDIRGPGTTPALFANMRMRCWHHLTASHLNEMRWHYSCQPADCIPTNNIWAIRSEANGMSLFLGCSDSCILLLLLKVQSEHQGEGKFSEPKRGEMRPRYCMPSLCYNCKRIVSQRFWTVEDFRRVLQRDIRQCI